MATAAKSKLKLDMSEHAANYVMQESNKAIGKSYLWVKQDAL